FSVRRPERWVPGINTAGQVVKPPRVAAVGLHHPDLRGKRAAGTGRVEEEDASAVGRPRGGAGAVSERAVPEQLELRAVGADGVDLVGAVEDDPRPVRGPVRMLDRSVDGG